MQYRKDRYGRELSVLGFGCMRFTRKGTAIDLDKAEQEIMAAFRAGVNYYDTAYLYPGRGSGIMYISQPSCPSIWSAACPERKNIFRRNWNVSGRIMSITT